MSPGQMYGRRRTAEGSRLRSTYPSYFSSSKHKGLSQSTDPPEASQMLRDISRILNGRMDPHLLVELLNQEFVMPREARIDSQLHREMHRLCEAGRLANSFPGVQPLPSELLHWRALVFLLGRLHPSSASTCRLTIQFYLSKGPDWIEGETPKARHLMHRDLHQPPPAG